MPHMTTVSPPRPAACLLACPPAQRSSALAKELKAYNAEMQRILAKYAHKLPPVRHFMPTVAI